MQTFSRGPLYHLREGEDDDHGQTQRFRTLNPTSEQQRGVLASSTNNSVMQ